MKKLKINLDRPYLNSEKIESKQNFNEVLNGSEKLKKPIWKKPWFYGPIGVASILFLITIGVDKEISNSNINLNDKTITLNNQNTLPEDTKCIHKPLENLEYKFQTFSINTELKQIIKLSSGTEITIPQGSLNSNSSEKIEIKIREFETKIESFIAGIPMDYKENFSFESAGMIEIRGTRDGEEVVISPSKPLKISMVLSKNPRNFYFWKLDESKKEWSNYPSKFKKVEAHLVENSELPTYTKIEKQLNGTQNLLKENNRKIQELVEPNLISYNLPVKENQHFDLDFNTKEFPELERFKGMEFEVISDKVAYDKSFTKKTWSSVELIKENDNYFAVFSSKEDKFKIAVRPVLNGKGKDLAELEFSKSYEFYNKTKNELENELKSLTIKLNLQQLKYNEILKVIDQGYMNGVDNKINSSQISVKENFKVEFTISTFGVYNCDKQISYPRPIDNEIIFRYNNLNPVEIIRAFVFDEKNDTRYSFGAIKSHRISDLGCFDEHVNTLLVIDREGRLGYVLNFNSSKINNGILKINLLDKKDQKLEILAKIIQKTSIES